MTAISPSISLVNLLQNIFPLENKWDRAITGLANDSRLVKAGDLFFAYPGAQNDGRLYIDSAIENGAIAIIKEAEHHKQTVELLTIQEKAIPIISLNNVSQYISEMAAIFYGWPAKKLKIIGITGTSGKTSCSQFIAACLHLAGHKCAVIGTLGNGIFGNLEHGHLTTPDAIQTQKVLAQFYEQGVQYVAMEVSSHALVQNRVKSVDFTIGVFTNLSHDHLDYHGDMENYAKAKYMLFSQIPLTAAVINADDPYGYQWIKELETLPVYAYSLMSNKNNIGNIPQIYISHISKSDVGLTASVHTPWGDGVLHNPHLIGYFNLSNLVAILAVLGILGIPLELALSYIAQLRGVPGRMETLGGGTQPLVVIDYAHKPDPLEQVLKALRAVCKRNLWCVFGCGGNRDKSKRPQMGKIAEYYADQLIITDDNPRQEDRRQIVEDIVAGLINPDKAVIIYDRRRAIEHAISCAQEGDIVLIAGKGHENYQIIGEEKIPFSDSLEAQLFLSQKNL